MPRISAGLLLYRWCNAQFEVLLVHPGGPFWRNKDHGAWTIPKGEPNPGEDLLAAAQREYTEETGFRPEGPYLPLTPIQQKGGKVIHAWAFEGDCDPSTITSNTFKMEWPPKSGKQADFPEVDRADFFTLNDASKRINPAQFPILTELALALQS